MSKRESTQEMDLGSRKYRERIHDRHKKMKDHLPIQPIMLPKVKAKNILFTCTKCETSMFGNKTTCIMICPHCKVLVYRDCDDDG